MQISDLNIKALTNPAWVAFDDTNRDTYRADFNQIIDDAVAEAFTSADVSGGVVDYTSGDSSNPSSWTDVTVMSSGSTLATLMNRISTMIKNVRYIWKKIGTTDISGIGGGTLTGAVSLLSGAIATEQKQSSAISVSANGTATFDINITKTGYTPIGIIQLQNSSGTNVIINGYWMNSNKTILSIYMRNILSAELSVYALATITYVKNELV